MDRSRTPPRNTFSGMNVPGMDRPGTPPINSFSFSNMAYQQPRRRMLQVAPQFVPGQTGQSNLDFIRHEMSMSPSKKGRKSVSKKGKKSRSRKAVSKKSRKGSKKGKKSRKGSKKGKKSSAKKNRLFKAAVVSRSCGPTGLCF